MSRTAASTRARRLLAILHLFAEDTEIPLEDLAAAVGSTPAELADDLETLSCCGVAPYSPDALVSIFVEDGMVTAWGALPALDRAVRLSAREAQALAVALQAAGMSADDPLPRRLLDAAAIDVDPVDLERVMRAAVSPDAGAYRVLALALSRHTAVRIAYRRAGAMTDRERVIEPLALLNERGAWYVQAFCRSAGAARTFRIDRIRHAEDTGDTFVPRDLGTTGSAFSVDGLPLARVRLDAGEPVSEREWPGMRPDETTGDGSVIVTVPYAGTAWIARQVTARMGSAEVLEPAELRDAVRALAADEGVAAS